MTDYKYLYNREYYGDLLTAESCIEKKPGWSIFPDAVLLPHKDVDGEICGGLMDGQGGYVDGSGIHKGMGGLYEYSSDDVKDFEEDVVYLGLWPDVWGHCLTDNIRRLWVLQNEEFMSKYGNLRFLYAPMHGKKLGHNFRELLNILGTESIRLEPIENVAHFRNVILPDECFLREKNGTRLFTKEYRDMIDHIRAYGERHFTKTNDTKLYFTYKNFDSMRTVGERKLERFFSGLGYKIVSPEDYTFVEQLNMLLNCEAFASTIGSGAHNSIFLRDGTTVHLIPRVGFITEYQPALDKVHDLDIHYVDSSLSLYAAPNRPWDGPFYYIISRQLQDCFGHRCGQGAKVSDFIIYRNLAYVMNGTCEPADYYNNIINEYIPLDPAWKPRESFLVRQCRKYRIRRLIAKYLG